MTRHYNSSIVERANRILASKAGDYLSDEVEDKIRAVIPINPIARIIKAAGSGVSGTLTPYTTPTDKDFYLTNLTFAIAKDATCDLATASISPQVTVDGVVTNPASIQVITLTAQNTVVNQAFNPPIKVDRGTSIQLAGNFTVGVLRKSINIIGYTEEVTRN